MDVLGEFEKRVVTLLVMSACSYFPGAPRGGTDFRDPAAVFRLSLLLIRESQYQYSDKDDTSVLLLMGVFL